MTHSWNHGLGQTVTALMAAGMELTGLAEVSSTIQEYEGARSLAWESSAHRELLSPGLRALLRSGEQIDLVEYEIEARVA